MGLGVELALDDPPGQVDGQRGALLGQFPDGIGGGLLDVTQGPAVLGLGVGLGLRSGHQ